MGVGGGGGWGGGGGGGGGGRYYLQGELYTVVETSTEQAAVSR